MRKITLFNAADYALDISRRLEVSPREQKPGPPERIDGLTVGIVTMTTDAPHGGEMHPDGDEILYVISGKLRIVGESFPDNSIEVKPGQVCIVPRGEWHRVSVIRETQLVHITPGPGGNHRPIVGG